MLVIGASGLVGRALMDAFGPNAVGTYRTRPAPSLVCLDANDRTAVHKVLSAASPDLILFPAAEPNVDWCEEHPRDAEERNLAPLRATLDAAGELPVLAFSSDYVFDGLSGPYPEGAERRPLSVYGRIKLQLEDMVLARGGGVIRTTTVFGKEEPPAKNFALRTLANLRRSEPIRVADDQFSTPTYATDLATAVVNIVASPHGIWHVAGPELMPRVELARRVATLAGADPRLVKGVPTRSLGQTAARPMRGGLSCERYRAVFGRQPGRPVDEALLDLFSRGQT